MKMLREFAMKTAAGSWEDGSFCLLEHKPYNQGGQNMVMVDRYHGLVLSETERNHYDDSDFYATVWDETTQSPKSVMWATTRAWTYPCGCVVDATDEVRAKYAAWTEARKVAWKEYQSQLQKYIPTPGRRVRSLTTRGKAKGKQGEIVWVKFTDFGHTIKFIADTGEAVFVAVDRVELFDDDSQSWVICAHWSDRLKTWNISEGVLPSPKF
jgi:hypothetical protein